ncbi:MAG: response regulator [Desulfobacterales bacterium]|nr:response regulator [Desulfobacterales bacterium]
MSVTDTVAKILFIDGSSFGHDLIKTSFSRYLTGYHLEFVSTAEQGLEVIKRDHVKAVFVSQELPDMDGFELLREVKELKIQSPVIMMATDGAKRVAIKALKKGAEDCVTKSLKTFDAFPLILERAIFRYELNREMAKRDKLIIQSQKRWRAIFDAIVDFIFVIDDDYRLIKVNNTLAKVLGMHPKELIGKRCNELNNTIDVPDERCLKDVIKDGAPYIYEKNIGDDTYQISIFPLYDDDKPMTIHVMKNITEMRRLKEQLYHSEKLASLGLLVSGVAHEINNPLTGIIAYTELLGMSVVDEETSKKLGKILYSAERCKKIVENLLTFSRQKNPSKSLESINDIIDRVVDFRAYWLGVNNIEIEKDYDELSTVLVDSQQIQQAILNILLNAEQAMVDSNVDNRRIKFTTRYDRDNRKIIIKISDNGPGIPQNIISSIFDPFFTTKPAGSGTGLGLSISHGIIVEHEGNIMVKSPKGKGATFFIELPLAKK